jgi:brefeldin A-resistance guanine nucleotide exchange factor 1
MSDESVCELLEVGLGMLARARLTEGLRNSAGACVQAITRAVFTRLKGLTPEDVDRLVAATQEVEKKQKEKNLAEEKTHNGREEGAEAGAGAERTASLDSAEGQSHTISTQSSPEI